MFGPPKDVWSRGQQHVSVVKKGRKERESVREVSKQSKAYKGEERVYSSFGRAAEPWSTKTGTMGRAEAKPRGISHLVARDAADTPGAGQYDLARTDNAPATYACVMSKKASRSKKDLTPDPTPAPGGSIKYSSFDRAAEKGLYQGNCSNIYNNTRRMPSNGDQSGNSVCFGTGGRDQWVKDMAQSPGPAAYDVKKAGELLKPGAYSATLGTKNMQRPDINTTVVTQSIVMRLEPSTDRAPGDYFEPSDFDTTAHTFNHYALQQAHEKERSSCGSPRSLGRRSTVASSRGGRSPRSSSASTTPARKAPLPRFRAASTDGGSSAARSPRGRAGASPSPPPVPPSAP